jgi:urease alpha subunit
MTSVSEQLLDSTFMVAQEDTAPRNIAEDFNFNEQRCRNIILAKENFLKNLTSRSIPQI